MAVFKSSPVSTGLERAGRQQGGHGQKRSSLVGRIRITGFGRMGQVTHWYMGGILTKNQEQGYPKSQRKKRKRQCTEIYVTAWSGKLWLGCIAEPI